MIKIIIALNHKFNHIVDSSLTVIVDEINPV